MISVVFAFVVAIALFMFFKQTRWMGVIGIFVLLWRSGCCSVGEPETLDGQSPGYFRALRREDHGRPSCLCSSYCSERPW
jgi:hypothetical protein